MESANVFGSDEDCPSCESGWTMYLASHSQDHDDGFHYEDDDDEEDSDGGDSMDSDASSGPMEAISVGLKSPQKIEEQNSIKKKNKMKTNEEMVMVETTRVKDGDDDDDNGDDHDYDDGNDSYSVVHSYVGSVFRQVKG